MSTENLKSKEAIKKMKDMVDDIDFCMMLTDLDNAPVSAIPMSTKKVDELGNIWFLSGMNSDHNKNINKDPRVQLLYSDTGDMEFISIYGKTSIVKDRSILEELYEKADDTWFDGVNDPNLTALKFNPSEAHYWDTKNNKYVTMFKMGIGAITGNKQDAGVEGDMNL